MPPSFSVVIPTYNQADFLRVALESVFQQSFQGFEVLVVNNFSTDHTLDVVEEFSDQRLRVINYRNQGIIGAGRNRGIEASTGEYIAFLDSDDTWHPNKLERVAEITDADPDVGAVCHDQTYIRYGSPAGYSKYGPPSSNSANLYDYMLLTGNIPSTSATIVARKFLEQEKGFSEDPSLITVEDYDLWLRLSRICRFRFLEDVLGTHNYHTASASANIELHLKNSLAVLDQHFSRSKGEPKSYRAGAIKRRYAYAYYGAARQYHRGGHPGASLTRYAQAMRTYPLFSRSYAGMMLLLASLIFKRPKLNQAANSTPRPGKQTEGSSK